MRIHKELAQEATEIMLSQMNEQAYDHWSLFQSMRRHYKTNRDILFRSISHGVREAYKCKKAPVTDRQVVSLVNEQFKTGSMSKMHWKVDEISEKVYQEFLQEGN